MNVRRSKGCNCAWSSIGGIFSVRDSRFQVSPKNPMSEVAMPRVRFTRIARGQRTVYRLINGWLNRPALRKFLSLEFYVFRFLGLVIRTSQYQNGDQHGSKRISCYFPYFHENYTWRWTLEVFADAVTPYIIKKSLGWPLRYEYV